MPKARLTMHLELDLFSIFSFPFRLSTSFHVSAYSLTFANWVNIKQPAVVEVVLLLHDVVYVCANKCKIEFEHL